MSLLSVYRVSVMKKWKKTVSWWDSGKLFLLQILVRTFSEQPIITLIVTAVSDSRTCTLTQLCLQRFLYNFCNLLACGSYWRYFLRLYRWESLDRHACLWWMLSVMILFVSQSLCLNCGNEQVVKVFDNSCTEWPHTHGVQCTIRTPRQT